MGLSQLCTVLTVLACLTSTCEAKSQKLEIITEMKPESCDEKAEPGDEVHVHYTGYLETGTVFDSSRQGNRGPLPFVLGQGKVIKGWEQGIKGMCVGEKRKLIIPPHLAYGSQGHHPVIPPDATLTFSTELVAVKKKGSEEVFFRLLRFLIVPVAAVTVIYYLYNRLKKKEPTRRQAKGPGARTGKKKAN